MTTLALPFVIPWASGAVLLIVDGRRRAAGWAAVAVQAASLAALCVLAASVLTDGARNFVTGGWPAGVGIVVSADPLGVVFALLSAFVLLVALTHQVLDGVHTPAFPALAVLLGAGLNGLFLAGDVFNFYVFFELAMTTSYILTAYGGGQRELWAALVFAGANILGSFVFLISVAGLYSVTGTLAMDAVAASMLTVEPTAGLLIAAGFFVAFSVKLGLFPFHFWLPTVYSGAQPAVAAILSGALTNIGAYGVLRFGAGLLPASVSLAAPTLIVIGCASILYGGVLAVGAGRTPETLAYSAVGQVGYVLAAVGVGGPVGLAAAVLYSVVNAVNKALLFTVSGLRGALVAFAFAVGAFSVAGVPPAAGFLGKLEVFRAGIDLESPALVAVVLAGGVLSIIYMFQLYQREFWNADDTGTASPVTQRVLTGALAVVILAAGLWPEPLLALSQTAAAVLPGGRS